jgi:integrase
MAEQLLDKIRNTNFLKEKTKAEYIKRITNFCNHVNKDLLYCIKNPQWLVKEILQYVEENKYGMHTADKICSCFMAIFTYNQEFKETNKQLYDDWIIETKHIKDKINIKYESNRPTAKQETAYINFEKVVEIRNSLKEGTQERLLLFMYTEIPPVRNDYHMMRIYKKTPKFDVGNYFIMNKNPMIVLNEFKTDKTYAKINITIPQSLLKEIEQSLTAQPRDYLFTSGRDNLPYNSDNTFSRWANRTLKTIFKNNMSLTTLRHIYITRRDLKLEEKSGTERKEIAKIMAHSLEQQQKYLWHTWVKDNTII